jgi:hypothetical protein
MRERHQPEEYQPSKIEVLDHGFFVEFKILVRDHKPTRRLAELSIAFPEIGDRLGSIETVYPVLVEPSGRAGDHYHLEKSELILVSKGNLVLCLQSIDDPEKVSVVGLEGLEKEIITCILTPPRVAHAFVNPSKDEDLAYLVLANKNNTLGDEFPFKVEVADFMENVKLKVGM